MTKIDLAERVHNHNYRLDPYVRSLLDTDFYKLLMCYFAWKLYPDVRVKFAMKNRSAAKVKMRDLINEEDLRAQLDFVRDLRFKESELIWLQGARFYGRRDIFPGEFVDFLRNLRLPAYQLGVGEDGDYSLEFEGTWAEVMLWEIYSLAIANEARSRAGMAGMTHYQLRVLYANATTKIVTKLKDLKEAGVPRIAEFGTRRRHGFLWQEFCIEAMQEELGDNFLGTSNALHAMRFGIEAIGTNAHELPMVIAALSRLEDGSPEALYRSQYRVLEEWQKLFGGNLLVALPDTFGTTQFLQGAKEQFPDIANWRGFREDSKDPFVGAEEKIEFWKGLGVDPREKLQLFSDGLDVNQMIELHKTFGGRITDGYGWGTTATNDFRGCDPRGLTLLDPISVVCKVREVAKVEGGQKISAVKLSDNYAKATGSPEEVAFYRETFGSEGLENAPTIV
jgi:nicotinate phosphoribosyltransferase